MRAALAGACDIIAEEVLTTAEYRQMIRSLTSEWGSISSKLSGEDGDSIFRSAYCKRYQRFLPHRYLAMNQREKTRARLEIAP